MAQECSYGFHIKTQAQVHEDLDNDFELTMPARLVQRFLKQDIMEDIKRRRCWAVHKGQ